MPRSFALLLAAALALAPPAFAQLSPPNSAGVAMGHLHYVVRDVAANKAFFVALGGEPLVVEGIEAVKFPDVLVLLFQGDTPRTSS